MAELSPPNELAAQCPPEYLGYAAYKGWTGIDEGSWPEFVQMFDAAHNGIELNGRHVLEIGFGNGEFLRYAQERGAAVTGLEINPELVARQTAMGYDVRLSRFYDDHSVPERSFDLAPAFDVLEHLSPDEIRAFLRRAGCVLRPREFLALRFPNGQRPFALYPHAGDLTHRTLLTARAVAQAALPCGFQVIRSGNAYRDPGRGLADRARRRLAYFLRDGIEYAVGLPYFARRIDLHPNLSLAPSRLMTAAPSMLSPISLAPSR